jgi:hypothetical protein
MLASLTKRGTRGGVARGSPSAASGEEGTDGQQLWMMTTARLQVDMESCGIRKGPARSHGSYGASNPASPR